MTKYIPVTPTLSSTTGYLVDLRDQVVNLVRFIIMNPGFTSSLWESRMLSFRTLAASYQNKSTELANAVSSRLKSNLSRRFTDCDFDVSVVPSNKDTTAVVYSLTFDIFITSLATGVSEPAIVSGMIDIDPDTNAITLNYKQNSDTISLS